MAVITYKCPNCGGDLKFDPASQSYACEYCRSQFTQKQLDEMKEQVETTAAEEHVEADGDAGAAGVASGVAGDAAAGSVGSTGTAGAAGGSTGAAGGSTGAPGNSAGGTGNAVVYHCPSCGAEIVTDENTAATFCYYCHSPVVLEGRLSGEYLPNHVIPFAIDKKKALQIFDQWIGRKKYIPKAFYNKDQIDKMTGVYFPYWLYSCDVDGTLDAEGIKRKSWVVGNLRYTQTDKYDVSRQGEMQVQHVTRNALSKANRQLIEGVLPFEMDKIQPFQMSYLSGFQAERRDMGEEKFKDEIQQEVKTFAGQTLKSEVAGYDAVQVRSQTADLKNETWDYALMPVWTLTYKEPKDGKIYYFACNGQTGKICGELPVDNGRLITLFASIFAPLFVVLMIVGYFL